MYSECFPRNRLFVRPSPSPSSPSSSSSSSTWTVVSALEWEARRTHASCACLRFSRVIDERWRETRESRAPPSRHIHWSDLYLCTPTSTVLPPRIVPRGGGDGSAIPAIVFRLSTSRNRSLGISVPVPAERWEGRRSLGCFWIVVVGRGRSKIGIGCKIRMLTSIASLLLMFPSCSFVRRFFGFAWNANGTVSKERRRLVYEIRRNFSKVDIY